MATSTKRSSASAVPKSAIEQATSILHDLPEKPREVRSLRETIQVMRDTILATLEKGYNHDEIAKILSDKGVGIRPSSLRYYLNASKRDQPDSSQTRVRIPRKPRMKKTAEIVSHIEDMDDSPVVIAASESPVMQSSEPSEKSTARVSKGEQGEKSVSQEVAPVKSTAATKSKVPTRSKTAAKAKPRSTSKVNTASSRSASSEKGLRKKGTSS